jgi:hypothetical protein
MNALALLAAAYGDENPRATLADEEETAAYLVTVGEDGWPHAAMLSVGELVVRANGACGLAMWARTRTTANLLRTSQATLLSVVDGQAVRAKLQVTRVPGGMAAGPVELTYFTGVVAESVAESAPYAQLTAGVRFSLHDRDSVVLRWQETRGTLGSLLA